MYSAQKQSTMTEKTPVNNDANTKKGRKGDVASKSSNRIWGEARKEIIPLSIGAIALIASSSVNQGKFPASPLPILYVYFGMIWLRRDGRED